MEEESAGFFVRRAIKTTAGGTTVGDRLPGNIIPAAGAGTYTIIDPSGTKDSLYYLEEITVKGDSNFHGPVGPNSRTTGLRDWTMF